LGAPYADRVYGDDPWVFMPSGTRDSAYWAELERNGRACWPKHHDNDEGGEPDIDVRMRPEDVYRFDDKVDTSYFAERDSSSAERGISSAERGSSFADSDSSFVDDSASLPSSLAERPIFVQRVSSADDTASEPASCSDTDSGTRRRTSPSVDRPSTRSREDGPSTRSREDGLHRAVSRLEALLMCPITLHTMHDPVITPDGITYDRWAITGWLEHNASEPSTRNPLTLSQLVPNAVAHAALALLLELRPEQCT
jgi:hypothetical protein